MRRGEARRDGARWGATGGSANEAAFVLGNGQTVAIMSHCGQAVRRAQCAVKVLAARECRPCLLAPWLDFVGQQRLAGQRSGLAAVAQAHTRSFRWAGIDCRQGQQRQALRCVRLEPPAHLAHALALAVCRVGLDGDDAGHSSTERSIRNAACFISVVAWSLISTHRAAQMELGLRVPIAATHSPDAPPATTHAVRVASQMLGRIGSASLSWCQPGCSPTIHQASNAP